MSEGKILEVGTRMSDGSIYAGLTSDGKQEIYALPDDLDVAMIFNNCVKAVKKLNNYKALGHDDWQIPDLNTLKALQKNHNEGSLKDTFNTTNECPGNYWSSTLTEHPQQPGNMHTLWFLDGAPSWGYKDRDYGRFSCRPVRLVPVKL
ncbi:MAG: DUF1566 domain-containing protein [Alphaproteobacteria bacterium]|nr:DUF1566 domain-containing protein [Alphaproteobacteria bacterium]